MGSELTGITIVVLGAFIAGGTPQAVAADVVVEPMPAVVREVTSAMGFEDADLARIWSGEIVARRLSERSNTELAIALIMRLRENHRSFYERVRRGQLFDIDRTVIHSEEIPPRSGGPAVFANLRLDPDELRRLERTRPGAEFNLSDAESAALRRAAGAGDDAVLAAYRQVLADRLHAYRESGIDGVAPYTRGKREQARPAEHLRRAISSIAGLADRCPSFYRSFADFPVRRDPKVSHRLFWALQRIHGRPSVILSHWALQLHEEFAVIGERQFYVGQGYDALQAVVGAFSIAEEESLVFYVNRTSTDQLAGFGSSLAHALGRRMMLREVFTLFRQLRESVRADNNRR